LKAVIRSLLASYDRNVVFQPEPLIINRDSVIRPTLRMLVRDLLDLNDATFMIIGAFDGITNDETYPLVRQYHFRGLALEPQPAAFARLAKAYQDEPQVVLRNAAIDWKPGQREMFAVKPEFHTDEFRPQLASFSREVMLRYPGLAESEIESSSVDCVTVHDCLAEAKLDRVDLLQIDTEGFDFEVIKMLDAAGIAPKIIRYEHHHLSRSDNHACLRHLMKKGYRISYHENDALAALM